MAITEGTWSNPLNSAIKLPDLGITEALGGLFGSNPNQSQAAQGALDYTNAAIPKGTTMNTPISQTGFKPSVSVNGVYPTTDYKAPSGTNQQSNSGTDFDSIFSSMYPGWDRTAAEQDWIAKGRPSGSGSGNSINDMTNRIRGEIEGGYNEYFKQLDDMMNVGLVNQRGAQEGIVQNQYKSGVEDLGLQERTGLQDLGTERESAVTNQSKNLKDLSENLRNMFMAGNVYLGSRGAGDSSAASQYSYALTKQGNKARGDVMSQTSNILAEIGKRETTLKDTVATETRKLDNEKNSKLLEVAQWFDNAQNQIKQAKAQGQLQKGTDLANLSKSMLENAMNRLNTIDTEYRGKQTALQEWAMNNATSINQLKQNLASVAQFNPTMPTVNQFSGTPTVDSRGNFSLANLQGWTTSDEEKKNSLFG